MELSETVKSSLRDAQEDLKNALAYAARTEKPYVSKHIATLLADIENLIDATEMIDKIENRKDGVSGMFGPFFNYPIMNNVGLEVVFWTILALYLLTKLGVFKK